MGKEDYAKTIYDNSFQTAMDDAVASLVEQISTIPPGFVLPEPKRPWWKRWFRRSK